MSSMPGAARGLEAQTLTSRERDAVHKTLGNPLEFPVIFKGWLETYLEPIVKDAIDRAVGAIPSYAPPVWQAYTPTWTVSAGSALIGNGALSGRYFQIGKFVQTNITFIVGSTTSLGTAGAFWRFGLPVAPSGLLSAGSAYVEDSGVTGYGALVRHEGGTNVILVVPAGGFVGPSAPFTWGTGDFFNLAIAYEAA